MFCHLDPSADGRDLKSSILIQWGTSTLWPADRSPDPSGRRLERFNCTITRDKIPGSQTTKPPPTPSRVEGLNTTITRGATSGTETFQYSQPRLYVGVEYLYPVRSAGISDHKPLPTLSLSRG